MSRPLAPRGCKACGGKPDRGTNDLPIILGEIPAVPNLRRVTVLRNGLGVPYDSEAIVDGTDVNLFIANGWLVPV